jgi:hypothetical protein
LKELCSIVVPQEFFLAKWQLIYLTLLVDQSELKLSAWWLSPFEA